MVDLPSVPRRLVTTETPHNRVTGEDIAAPGRAAARALGGIGEDLTEIARAARNRQMTALGNSIDTDLAKASLDNAGNPEGFKSWAEGYGRQLQRRERSPFMKRAVVDMVNTEATRKYNGLTTQLHQATMTNAKTSMVARIDQLDDRLAQIARDGGTASEEYRATVAERDDLYGELERQPLYGMPAEVNKIAKARSEGRHVAEAVVGLWKRHNFARSGTWSTRDVQHAFVQHELGTTENAAGSRLKAATTVEQATEAMIGFERPQGWSADNPRGGNAWSARLANAERIAAGSVNGPEAAALAFYMGQGWTREQAAGIVGNLVAESGRNLDPGASGDPTVPGGSRGIAQWNRERLARLQQFAGGGADAESLLREQIWAIPDLSPEDRDRYINYGIGEMNKIDAERKRVAGEHAETYERSIIDAAAGAGPIFARSAIEEDPILTEALRNTLLTKYDKAADDLGFSNGAYGRFADGGEFNAFDPKDRKAVDGIYKTLGGDGTALKQVVDQTGIAPPSVVTGLRGDIVSTDPARLGAGLQLAANLVTANPNVFAGHDGGSDVEKAALTFRHFVDNYGYSAEEAAARMAEMNTPEFKARVSAQVKGEDVNEIVKKNLALGDLESAFDAPGIAGLLPGRPTIGFTPEARNGMFGDYADLFRDRYLETGDTTLAKGQAIAQLKKVWGVSGVNGSEVVMRYPPEKAPGLESVENAGDLIAADAIESIQSDILGRPVIANPDGSISSEETITIQNAAGQWVNIPTIVGGARVGEEAAVAAFRAGGNPAVGGPFGNETEAAAAARARTEKLGQLTNIDRASLALLPIAGITSTAFKSGQPVPYQLAWTDADGIVHRTNPGRGFVVDPALIKQRQSAEREKAFRESGPKAPLGTMITRRGPIPVKPWDIPVDPKSGVPTDPEKRALIEQQSGVPPPTGEVRDPFAGTTIQERGLTPRQLPLIDLLGPKGKGRGKRGK